MVRFSSSSRPLYFGRPRLGAGAPLPGGNPPPAQRSHLIAVQLCSGVVHCALEGDGGEKNHTQQQLDPIPFNPNPPILEWRSGGEGPQRRANLLMCWGQLPPQSRRTKIFGPHIAATPQKIFKSRLFQFRSVFDQSCSVGQLVWSPTAKPSGQPVISEPAKNSTP